MAHLNMMVNITYAYGRAGMSTWPWALYALAGCSNYHTNGLISGVIVDSFLRQGGVHRFCNNRCLSGIMLLPTVLCEGFLGGRSAAIWMTFQSRVLCFWSEERHTGRGRKTKQSIFCWSFLMNDFPVVFLPIKISLGTFAVCVRACIRRMSSNNYYEKRVVWLFGRPWRSVRAPGRTGIWYIPGSFAITVRERKRKTRKNPQEENRYC